MFALISLTSILYLIITVLALKKLFRLFQLTSVMYPPKVFFSALSLMALVRAFQIPYAIYGTSINRAEQVEFVTKFTHVLYMAAMSSLIIAMFDIYYERKSHRGSMKNPVIYALVVFFVVNSIVLFMIREDHFETWYNGLSTAMDFVFSLGLVFGSRLIVDLSKAGTEQHKFATRVFSVNLAIACIICFIRAPILFWRISGNLKNNSVLVIFLVTIFYLITTEIVPAFLLLLYVFETAPRRSEFNNQKLTSIVLLSQEEK